MIEEDDTVIVIGIVALYNPRLDEIETNIKSYLSDLDMLICVDNSEKEISIDFIRNNKKICYIKMPTNVGLARALLYGIDVCKEMKAEFISLFDQDSVFKQESFKILKNYIMSNNKCGMVAPNISLIFRYKNTNERFFSNDVLYSKSDSEITWAINSGAIIRMSAYLLTPGIEEKVFISGIDRVNSMNIHDTGYSIIRVGNAVLYQEAGNTKELRIFGHTFHPPYLSSLRYYFEFKDGIYLRLKYGRKYKKYKGNLLKLFVCVVFFENRKLSKMNSVFRGILDAFKQYIEFKINKR